MSQINLYPTIEPFASGRLPLGSPHVMYWEQSGHPDGCPVVFLHGGPGAGASPSNRRYFDPTHYRIIIYDQRGAGRSAPLGSLVDNTTQHLIDDLEQLRRFLKIESWIVFGGSWGSTLALAYAEAHPERCQALVLRGIFLCQPEEIEWFLHGMGRFFPEAWTEFVGHLRADERDDILANYYRRLIDSDPAVHVPAALAWSRYEGRCSTLLPSLETEQAFGKERMALGLARIEAHYFVNRLFLPSGALLTAIKRIHDIPGYIVQGRYDMVCPPRTADMLHRAWPRSRLKMVPEAGHSSLEPGISRALVAVMDTLRDQGSGG